MPNGNVATSLKPYAGVAKKIKNWLSILIGFLVILAFIFTFKSCGTSKTAKINSESSIGTVNSSQVLSLPVFERPEKCDQRHFRVIHAGTPSEVEFRFEEGVRCYAFQLQPKAISPSFLRPKNVNGFYMELGESGIIAVAEIETATFPDLMDKEEKDVFYQKGLKYDFRSENREMTSIRVKEVSKSTVMYVYIE